MFRWTVLYVYITHLVMRHTFKSEVQMHSKIKSMLFSIIQPCHQISCFFWAASPRPCSHHFWFGLHLNPMPCYKLCTQIMMEIKQLFSRIYWLQYILQDISIFWSYNARLARRVPFPYISSSGPLWTLCLQAQLQSQGQKELIQPKIQSGTPQGLCDPLAENCQTRGSGGDIAPTPHMNPVWPGCCGIRCYPC